MEKSFLKLVPKGFHYLHIERSFGEDVFRIQEVTNATEVEEWLEAMSEETLTTWRVSRTYPTSGALYVFRKDFRCQHSTDRRTCGKKSSKNTNCPASLKIIIKNRKRKKAIVDVDEGDELMNDFPTEVRLRGEHNHELHGACALRYRDMSEQTKLELSILFCLGYSPSAALHSLKFDLIFDHPNDYEDVSVDGRFLPPRSVVRKLFKNEFETRYGSVDEEKTFLNVEEFIRNFNKSTGSVSEVRRTVDSVHYFAVVISSLMLRSHLKMKQCSEIVFLDVFGGTERQKHVIHLFVTPSAAGSLPLGVIITDSAEDYVLIEALQHFKHLLTNVGFFSIGYPKIFMTDNDVVALRSLRNVFPNSVFLCNQFYLLKSFWTWLCLGQHKIKTNDRIKFYDTFKRLVHASDVSEADLYAAELISTADSGGYTSLTKYFLSLWNVKLNWVSCFRNELLKASCNGFVTSNYFEIVFRILKDIIFQKTDTYNFAQLVHFVMTKYELYMKKRIVDFCIGVPPSCTNLLRLLSEEEYDVNSFSMDYDVENEVFVVTDLENDNETVDMIRGLCSCGGWNPRRRCVHSIVVFLNLENSSTAYNAADIGAKHNMLFVSEGVEVEWGESEISAMKREDQIALAQLYERGASETDIASVDRQSHLEDTSPVNNERTKSVIDETTIKNVQNEFQNLMRRIQDGLSSNPNVFLPALKKMLRNAKSFTNTDIGLVSALCSFGVHSNGGKSTSLGDSKNSPLEVDCDQPPGRKNSKFVLTGRKNLSVTRPLDTSLPELNSDLGSSNFQNVPSRKRKALDNLEECVLNNESISETSKKVIEIKAFKVL